MTITDLLDQIRFARAYTLRLLEHVPEEEWFRIPPAGVTHVAWQVGHLAMASYRLALERIRGRLPGDEALISEAFIAPFGRDSMPNSDPAQYPPLAEIRAVFDRVHERILEELPTMDSGSLDLPPHKPHVLCPTRRMCLVWCSHHEMIHGGQIGLLRRQLGHEPVW